MPSLTTRVTEHDIRVDDEAFFAFARSVKGRHTGWLREIGQAHAKGRPSRFSFKVFEGTKLVGYESNPELHVVLKAIEAYMKRSKTRAFGRVQIFGESDEVPRSILLDYFHGQLLFTYPVWHTLDLSSVALDVAPEKRPTSDGLQVGIAYLFRSRPKAKDHAVAAGVAGSTLYIGYPDWMRRKGRTTKYQSRAAALAALTRWYAEQERAGFELQQRDPLNELRRSAKKKFPDWSFG